MLGRGAYGLAVAAVNRLDGRQYAVKKIRVQQQVPNEFARIMREVATLSRLQHTNIVRYFQVCSRRQYLSLTLTCSLPLSLAIVEVAA